MLVMKWIEILTLAGYLECGSGFVGANYVFLTDLDYVARGGEGSLYFRDGRQRATRCVGCNLVGGQEILGPFERGGRYG